MIGDEPLNEKEKAELGRRAAELETRAQLRLEVELKGPN